MIDEIERQIKPLINGKLIYLSQYGSHLYGLNTENSDLDFRGVYIPELDDIILKKDKDEINKEIYVSNTEELYEFLEDKSIDSFQPKLTKVDVKIFSLQKFIQLCSKADTNALDLLFSIDTPADHTWQYKGLVKNVPEEMKYPLRYIHENKTGALLKLSIRMGAILANASEDKIEKLSNFADKIGLAFQIKDDILSEEGDEKITGKPVGNDKELNKCTYVSFYGLDGAKEELDKVINEALENIKDFGEEAEFLRELTLYIKNRNK